MDYLIGTCYQCAKCLYCKEDSLKSLCECDKNIAPTTRNRTKLVPYAFTIHYNTNLMITKLNKWYRIGKTKLTKSKLTKSTKSKLTKSTNSKLTKSISPTECATFDTNISESETDQLDDHTTFDTNNHITNIFETDQLDAFNTNKYNTNISKTHKLDFHTTFNTNKYISNIPEIDKLDDYTAFDYDTPVCDEFEDLLNEEVEELDLENNNFSRQLDKLDNENNKYETDSCGEFHYQILLHIQFQLNNTTITQNDYVLSYKVTKETGAGTQIINKSDFESFIEDYNQATNRKKRKPNSDDNLNKKKLHLFSRKPKESQLDDDKRIMASTISQIREKYFCANCEGSCWATKTADINASPSHAIFTLPPNKRRISNSQLSSQLSPQMSLQIPFQVLSQMSSQALTHIPSQMLSQMPSQIQPQLLLQPMQLSTNFLSQILNNFSPQLLNNLFSYLSNMPLQ
ncbi:16461_t:CDS:2 [Dentiscutata heterogama]|uniref:16461_t:CDS:1 n=1 Tax=Dentiscutata heterogama TaxID=1316150 RepID=A0ACA9K6T0_9GLOM|nr:16461_t:CDS:2 [Dentiscutata heterogama]